MFPEGLAKIRAWVFEVEARLWDRQIAKDFKVGKLNRLIAEAREDFEAGRAREIKDCKDTKDTKDKDTKAFLT